MSKFREDMRVTVTTADNELKKGTIKNVYDDIETAIVKFDDGQTCKVPFSQIVVCIEPNCQEMPESDIQETPEVKTEVQEGAKVITRDQFDEALGYLTSPEGMLDGIPKDKADEVDSLSLMLKGMTIMIVGSEIAEKLYQDKEEIEITKDQLREVITDGTNLEAIAKSINNEMSVTKVLPIALLSMLVLLKLVKIFFDDSEND